MSRRTEVGLINVMGLVQGLALVTFPAASSIFTSPHGFAFSASLYGMMVIPLFVAIFIGAGVWWLMPLMVAAVLTALVLLSTTVPLQASVGDLGYAASTERLPARFWLFAAAVFLYGFAETLNGNWSGPYLTR